MANQPGRIDKDADNRAADEALGVHREELDIDAIAAENTLRRPIKGGAGSMGNRSDKAAKLSDARAAKDFENGSDGELLRAAEARTLDIDPLSASDTLRPQGRRNNNANAMEKKVSGRAGRNETIIEEELARENHEELILNTQVAGDIAARASQPVPGTGAMMKNTEV
jgi:hypothetical protein